MGNPHIVFFTKSLDLIDLKQVGHDIETYKAFKKGVNIEVAQITSKSSLSLKFWERGAGETLSCGSGILAACFASFKNKQCSNSIKVALPIGSVSVNINNAQISITGKAEVSYLGEYHYA
jgi:diaminopimelate epimerase